MLKKTVLIVTLFIVLVIVTNYTRIDKYLFYRGTKIEDQSFLPLYYPNYYLTTADPFYLIESRIGNGSLFSTPYDHDIFSFIDSCAYLEFYVYVDSIAIVSSCIVICDKHASIKSKVKKRGIVWYTANVTNNEKKCFLLRAELVKYLNTNFKNSNRLKFYNPNELYIAHVNKESQLPKQFMELRDIP